MTFRHTKFEDSPTMRALEKVAREKGLVKPEPLTKQASLTKKADLTPSTNLMENILKLCNGLREKGMVKDAAELETKYLQYKQAQTLYEAHKETGEDLLEEAHPDGSHKLVDVDSTEAVVEDLLDKHDLIEEVAEKEPTAKWSDAVSVIKAVKKVLAQSTEEKQDATNLEAGRKVYTDLISQATSLAQQIISNEDLSDWSYQYSSWGLEWAGTAPEAQTGFSLKSTKSHFESLQGNLNNLIRKAPSIETVGVLKENLTAMMNLIQKASNISGVDKGKYLGRAQSIFSQTDDILKALRGEGPKSEAQESAAIKSKLIARLGALGRNLTYYKSILPTRLASTAIPQAQQIIQNYQGQVTALNTLLSDKGTTETEAAGREGDVKQLEDWINGFATNWHLASGSTPPTTGQPIASK
jgi:hypothetical protein